MILMTVIFNFGKNAKNMKKVLTIFDIYDIIHINNIIIYEWGIYYDSKRIESTLRRL